MSPYLSHSSTFPYYAEKKKKQGRKKEQRERQVLTWTEKSPHDAAGKPIWPTSCSSPPALSSRSHEATLFLEHVRYFGTSAGTLLPHKVLWLVLHFPSFLSNPLPSVAISWPPSLKFITPSSDDFYPLNCLSFAPPAPFSAYVLSNIYFLAI